MFLNSLYTIVSTEKTSIDDTHTDAICVVKLNEDHPIFAGHFPGQPILPGVCIIQMLIDIVSAWEGYSLKLKKSKNIKFLKIIDPKKTPEITLNIQMIYGADNLIQVKSDGVTDITFFKLNLELFK